MADIEIRLDGIFDEEKEEEKVEEASLTFEEENKEEQAQESEESTLEIERIKERVEKKREERKKKRERAQRIEKIICAVIALALIIGLCVFTIRSCGALMSNGGAGTSEQETKVTVEDIIKEADLLAAGYDYDGAIEKIKSFGEDYLEKEELMNAIAGYEGTKATMVRYPDVTKITHIFFHTLIVDTSKAFDGDYKQTGYNQYMTTVSEFNRMMEVMYNKGYVLVDIHDIAKEEAQSDGTVKFVPGDIWLPEGKIPFVISQDDVSYYNYMTGDGFASKIVIGADGYPTCEYINDDGTVTYGDYDLVPALETFIRNHPDFSYRGARAALAITGYDGVLGYRTCPTGDGYNPDDVEKAKQVAKRMVECGWTFASHSWGHQKYGRISYEKMKTDAQKWEDEVEPILGEVDVMIYANGDDLAGIEDYSGAKYELLKHFGFKYFCNVDSAKYWVQIRDGYVRQGRRNLDGYRMWHSPHKLEDLFKVEEVWDNTRPTPVPSIV